MNIIQQKIVLFKLTDRVIDFILIVFAIFSCKFIPLSNNALILIFGFLLRHICLALLISFL